MIRLKVSALSSVVGAVALMTTVEMMMVAVVEMAHGAALLRSSMACPSIRSRNYVLGTSPAPISGV